jgi:hypothetical protein
VGTKPRPPMGALPPRGTPRGTGGVRLSTKGVALLEAKEGAGEARGSEDATSILYIYQTHGTFKTRALTERWNAAQSNEGKEMFGTHFGLSVEPVCLSHVLVVAQS